MPIFAALFVLAALGLALFGPLLDRRRSRREQERAVTRRLSLFTWTLALLLLAGLIFLPNKARALSLTPLLLAGAALDWQWRQRWRPRREAVDLERMKRVYEGVTKR